MAYINKTVSIYGTEKDFIKAVVNELTSADNRITCETDIDAEFANEDSSYNMRIALNINNCYKLRFVREVKSQYVNYWYMEQVINNTVTNGAKVFYGGGGAVDTTTTTRNWKVIFISNDNAIAMIFGNHNSDFPNNYSYNVFSYHEQGFNVASMIPDEPSASQSALQADIIRTDEGNKGELYKASIDRLPYSRGDNFEIIESKLLLKDGIVERDMQNVLDCSTVAVGKALLIENNKYYPFSANTLIKIKE